MATYSLYANSLQTVVSQIRLANSATQSYTFNENNVFTDLLNNTDKKIMPISIRNAVMSVYESTPFKETVASGSNIYYIGIDDNPQNLKKHIYLGRRTNKGTDIMSNSLLTYSDITLNGTDTENSLNNESTVVKFLAGTNPNLFQTAPNVESRIVRNNDGSKRIDISIVNRGGDISVLSKLPNDNDPGSNILINGIKYPSVQESDPSSTIIGSASDGSTLSYQNGTMVWTELKPYDPGYYGVTATTVPIFGSASLINGYSLDFTDDRMVPLVVGGVKLGETFSHESIANVLEKIIYEYLPPICSISFVDAEMEYAEIGSSPVVSLNYSVTKRTYSTYPTALKNMKPNQLPEISSSNTETVNGVATGVMLTPLQKGVSDFVVVVSDGISTATATASVKAIYPFFFGITSNLVIDNYLLSELVSEVSPKVDKRIDFYQSDIKSTDKIYFIYDYEYGPLNKIIKPDGNDLSTGQYSIQNYVFSSPEGKWATKKFYIYRIDNIFSNYINQNTVSMYFGFDF